MAVVRRIFKVWLLKAYGIDGEEYRDWKIGKEIEVGPVWSIGHQVQKVEQKRHQNRRKEKGPNSHTSS